MARRQKAHKTGVSAIIDARAVIDGTPVSALNLAGMPLVHRALALAASMSDECILLGGDFGSVPDLPIPVRRVATLSGLLGIRHALGQVESQFVLAFDATQALPDHRAAEAVLDALRTRNAAGAFRRAQFTLARAQGNVVLSATPADQYWLAQSPHGFRREALSQWLAELEHLPGAQNMSLWEYALRLGQSIALIEGDQTGFRIQTALDWRLAESLAH